MRRSAALLARGGEKLANKETGEQPTVSLAGFLAPAVFCRSISQHKKKRGKGGNKEEGRLKKLEYFRTKQLKGKLGLPK